MKSILFLEFLFVTLSLASTTVQNEPKLSPRDESEDQTETIIRCRAVELSPGAALGIMVVLATTSAVHMPGSYFWIARRRGLYRIAPELGFLEVLGLLRLIFKGMFECKESFRKSVTAALVLRIASAEGEQWWKMRHVEARQPSEGGGTHTYIEPFIDRLRRLEQDRLIGIVLAIFALIKAFAVKGSIHTNLLAASYGVPFLAIEILSFSTIQIGPRKSIEEREAEAIACTELITMLDDSQDAWEHRSTPRWQQTPSDSWKVKVPYFIVMGLFALPAAGHLIYWPFSIPLFLLFDFQVHHKGKWVFIYSTFLEWIFWFGLVGSAIAAVVMLPAIVMWTIPERRDKWIHRCERVVTSWFRDSWWVDLYALAKFALITRYYLQTYTGAGTTKGAWLDWLG